MPPSIILLERSSILLPTCHAVAFGRRRKASSEALFYRFETSFRTIVGAALRRDCFEGCFVGSWHKAVPTTNNCRADRLPGSLDQFHFDSAEFQQTVFTLDSDVSGEVLDAPTGGDEGAIEPDFHGLSPAGYFVSLPLPRRPIDTFQSLDVRFTFEIRRPVWDHVGQGILVFERIHTLHLISVVGPAVFILLTGWPGADKDAAVGPFFQKPEFQDQGKIGKGLGGP